MAVCWAGTAGMAGTKGLGAGAGSAAFSAWDAGSGFAVTEAGAWPRALVGVRFTVSLGGQMGWTLSATLAVERHSVFQPGLAGSACFTGWALKAGRTSSLAGWGANAGLGAGAAGLFPCSR